MPTDQNERVVSRDGDDPNAVLRLVLKSVGSFFILIGIGLAFFPSIPADFLTLDTKIARMLGLGVIAMGLVDLIIAKTLFSPKR